MKILLLLLSFIFVACSPKAPLPSSELPKAGDFVIEEEEIEIIEKPEIEIAEETEPEPLTSDNLQLTTIVDNAVTFFPQAPYGHWDALHQEACEEASMIMVQSYFQKKDLNRHDFEQNILRSVQWQEDNNYTVDITAQEVSDILQSYYGVNSQLLHDVSAEALIDELDEGNLIIAPAAGRLLGNPYFTGAGPLYHMLVIRGYDNDTKEFITNDPGTKRGEGYKYKYNTLINAIHDWPQKGAPKDSISETQMNAGQKVVVVVEG